jgi:hypothetical protein
MNCGKVRYFFSSHAGFVRMELRAKCITKFIHAIRNWGQICPAKIRFGRFDSKGARRKIEFYGCLLEKINIEKMIHSFFIFKD